MVIELNVCAINEATILRCLLFKLVLTKGGGGGHYHTNNNFSIDAWN